MREGPMLEGGRACERGSYAGGRESLMLKGKRGEEKFHILEGAHAGWREKEEKFWSPC